MRECWLCGRNGAKDPLDRHHIFGGAYRGKSEALGLTVYLCHKRCHESGPKAVHVCAETAERLHKYGQAKAMREQGWSVEQFREEFGRNYLDEDEIEEIGETETPAPPARGGAFRALAAEMPF